MGIKGNGKVLIHTDKQYVVNVWKQSEPPFMNYTPHKLKKANRRKTAFKLP